MSKLDRQLDKIHNESRVVIEWPKDVEVDVDALRATLIEEIDQHHRRVPLDLRSVHGAPKALVKLLLEMQRYARSKDKVLAISYALAPMQDALNPRRRRKAGRSNEAIDQEGSIDAGEVAKSALDLDKGKSAASYDISRAEKIVRDPKKQKRRKRKTGAKSKLRRYLTMAGIILACTGILAAAEYYYLFHMQTSDVVVPDKTFED